MKSVVCEILGIEFPLLAFSHCRDVVAAVSRAGGMGVFGAVRYSPEQLREELTWIDDHCGGKPYGVDLIVPNRFEGKGEKRDTADLVKTLPQSHREFISGVLQAHDIDSDALDEAENGRLNFARNLEEAGAADMLDVAFSFPIRLIANALGTPPRVMIDQAKSRDVPVAALVGTESMRLPRLRPAWIFWSLRAVRPVVTAVISRPWCLFPKWFPSQGIRRCLRPVGSSRADRWRQRWPWEQPAPGVVRCG